MDRMDIRVGDVLDDYCSRCKRLTDHSVMALVNGEVARVNCRTCNRDHEFKHGKLPEPRGKAAKAKISAFNQVLAGIVGEQQAVSLEEEQPAKKPRGKKS